MEEVLGHRDLRLLEIEDQRLGVPTSMALASHSSVDMVGLPLSSFLPVSTSFEHVALHQADAPRNRSFIEAVLDVPRRILGGERARPYAT